MYFFFNFFFKIFFTVCDFDLLTHLTRKRLRLWSFLTCTTTSSIAKKIGCAGSRAFPFANAIIIISLNFACADLTKSPPVQTSITAHRRRRPPSAQFRGDNFLSLLQRSTKLRSRRIASTNLLVFSCAARSSIAMNILRSFSIFAFPAICMCLALPAVASPVDKKIYIVRRTKSPSEGPFLISTGVAVNDEGEEISTGIFAVLPTAWAPLLKKHIPANATSVDVSLDGVPAAGLIEILHYRPSTWTSPIQSLSSETRCISSK